MPNFQSISTKWKEFLLKPAATEVTTELSATTVQTNKANDLDNPVLKSVINSSASNNIHEVTPPVIGMVTHGSDETVERVPTSRTSASNKSLLDFFQNFDDPSDTSIEVDKTKTKNISEASISTNLSTEKQSTPAPASNSTEKTSSKKKTVDHKPLPTDILTVSSTFFTNGALSNYTCGPEYQNKWPIPETIEQVRQLCETEQENGNGISLLALCLHLMESAWQADPTNSTIITSPTSTISSKHKVFEDIISTLRPNHTINPPTTTLGQAMVYEARKILKSLAGSNQKEGRPGQAEAQFLLGSCYGIGALGFPINHDLAFQWYNQASKSAHPEATYRTAVCYELGIGMVAPDADRALTFYRKAAHLQHVPAMYKLGVILIRGYYQQVVSKREAVVWLQRAASTAIAPCPPGEDSTVIGGPKGVALPHALHALAMVHLNRECEATSMIPDTHYAIQLLHSAARLNYAPSQSKLGECYECGLFCAEDELQSIYWYSLSARQDYPEACLALSGWYLTGSLKTNQLEQSDSQAFLWAKKTVKLLKSRQQPKSLSAKAYYTLGIYYEKGIGVPKSSDLAVKWFKKAAALGHADAINKTSAVVS